MREALVKSDLIECVLGLGAGLFYNSPMEAVVIILRATKPKERKGRVLFINAINEVARQQAQSFLREGQQQKILDAYRGYVGIDHFASVASLDEIVARKYSLAIPLYVEGANTRDAQERLDVRDAVSNWRAAADASDNAIEDVLDLIRSELTA